MLVGGKGPGARSIGWPVDARTRTGIEAVPPDAWTPGLGADGDAEHDAHVAELTGLLRKGPAGDTLEGWPPDMRIFARRVPRPAGQQAPSYGAFVTNAAPNAGWPAPGPGRWRTPAPALRCTGCSPEEAREILALYDEWGEIVRSHRKLAHRESYLGRVWVSPSMEYSATRPRRPWVRPVLHACR